MDEISESVKCGEWMVLQASAGRYTHPNITDLEVLNEVSQIFLKIDFYLGG
jgi:hypothetical protein